MRARLAVVIPTPPTFLQSSKPQTHGPVSSPQERGLKLWRWGQDRPSYQNRAVTCPSLSAMESLPERKRTSASDGNSQWLGARGTWKSQAQVFATWPQKEGGLQSLREKPRRDPQEYLRSSRGDPLSQSRTVHIIAGPVMSTCWASLLDWPVSFTWHASH